MGKFTRDPRGDLRLCENAVANGCKPQWAALGRALGVPASSLKYRLTALGVTLDDLTGKQGQLAPDYLDTVRHHSDGSVESDRLITIFEQDAKNPRALLAAHGFDADAWELVSATSNMWHGMRANDAGQLVNMQSKIRVRPLEGDGLTLGAIRHFFEEFEIGKRSDVRVARGSRGGRVLEVCLADLHIGNATVDIAARTAYVIDDVLTEIQGMEIERIFLTPLGDTLHYDGFGRTTTRGTPLEGGMPPYEMFDLGERVLIDAVDRLAQVAPVEVVAIYGNHDRMLAYGLFKTLQAWYADVDGVTVDTSHAATKFRKFGNCLVLWDHGDMPKKRLQDLIYHEARAEFGQTLYAEIHSGHKHTQQADEGGGVILRRLPTITDTDEWHYLNGYRGSLRASMAFVWDQERGWKHLIQCGV